MSQRIGAEALVADAQSQFFFPYRRDLGRGLVAHSDKRYLLLGDGELHPQTPHIQQTGERLARTHLLTHQRRATRHHSAERCTEGTLFHVFACTHFCLTGFLQIGFHFHPFHLAQATFTMHSLQTAVGILCLTQSGQSSGM